jgi:hypothetical protein
MQGTYTMQKNTMENHLTDDLKRRTKLKGAIIMMRTYNVKNNLEALHARGYLKKET